MSTVIHLKIGGSFVAEAKPSIDPSGSIVAVGHFAEGHAELPIGRTGLLIPEGNIAFMVIDPSDVDAINAS